MPRSFEAVSSLVLGAAVDVHRALRPGFLEHTYGRALRVALRARGVSYHAEREVPLSFGGEAVGSYRLDLVVEDTVLVELKAVRRFEELHFAQVRAYLKAAQLHVGLLLNFNAKVLAVRRVVHQLPE
ncbi:MAG TPA: GxxExxY protein [Gemmatimonadales bacterium]|nr:GxxExxY protein [Gemmatimonadales bacterium]